MNSYFKSLIFFTNHLKFLLVLIFFILPISIRAIGYPLSLGASSRGTGGISLLLDNVWAIHNNPAGISNLDKVSVGFFYETRFNIKELSTKSLGIVMPTKTGNFGMLYYHNGFSEFNQQKIGIAYAKKWGDKISVGLQISYNSILFSNTDGSKGTFIIEGGVFAAPINNLKIGFHIFNPSKAKITTRYYEEKYPTLGKLGVCYGLTKSFLMATELIIDILNYVHFKTGLEYSLDEKYFLRYGISTHPFKNSFGFGFVFKDDKKIDISLSQFQKIGYITSISLQYNL